MKIRHCGSYRMTKTHWLYSSEPKFKYIIVYILAACPVCCFPVVEWSGVAHNNQRTPLHRVKLKDIDIWLERIKTSEVNGKGKGYSEYTSEIKQDTAKVYNRVLERHGVKGYRKDRKGHYGNL